MGTLLSVFFALMIGHAFADYVFQSELMSRNKRRKHNPDGWWATLAAHALVHGGMVLIVLASPLLAFFEFLAHFTIDFFRCEEKYSWQVDQLLHVWCKVSWIILFLFGIG